MKYEVKYLLAETVTVVKHVCLLSEKLHSTILQLVYWIMDAIKDDTVKLTFFTCDNNHYYVFR